MFDKKKEEELRERRQATIDRLEGTVKRFRWQPPEYHDAMLWNCFAILSEHFARSNAVGEINHVVSILENIDRRCGEEEEIRETLEKAVVGHKDLHRLREIFKCE